MVIRDNAVKDYVDHLKSTVPFSLTGMTVAVDCANGSASVTARRLFTELGADCHVLFDQPDGLNINAGCGSTHLDALRGYVLEHGLDIGVAFDGDADRCLCVDGSGNVVDGDFIMAICALDMMKRGKLEKNTVVGTIMANMGFGRFCEENGIEVQEVTVTTSNDVQQAVETLCASCDAIFSPNDNTVASAMSAAAQAALENQIPFYTGADSMVSDGGFMTVGIDYTELGRETARMVDQVLKGTDVADIPVKQFKSDLSIYVNRDVMEALGITLPDSIANSENLVMMEQE